MTNKKRTDKRTETRACDLISRQAAVELAMKYCPDDDGAVQCDGDIRGLLDELENLPPAQPEHDAEFWRKRAEEYSNICLAMTAEMTKGIKFDSIRIDENGIAFGKERPERKVGKWTEDNACEFCGFKPWYERDIHTLSYCPNCGADMRGKK